MATWGEKFPVTGNSESKDQEEGMCWLFLRRAMSPERLASEGRCGRKCGHGGGRAEGLRTLLRLVCGVPGRFEQRHARF